MIKNHLVLFLFFFPLLALANPGPYLKAEIGTVNQSEFFNSTSGYGGRISAGTLFGKNYFNYGLEVGYLAYPHLSGQNCFITCSDDLTQGSGLDLLGLVKYTFDSNLLIFAKAGAAYSRQTFLNKDSTYSYHSVETGFGPEIALGLGYKYQQIEVDLTGSAMGTRGGLISTLFLGLVYSF